MTAVMICLANIVETLQGDTSTAVGDVHDKNVVSYGNRLYCRFDKDKADFSWGNSTTYSQKLYGNVCKSEEEQAPMGIPQGLVSGGFLANIYMLDFDEWIAKKIGTTIGENIKLVDYCRYVDDMRLIIVVTKGYSLSDIQDQIECFFNTAFDHLGLRKPDDQMQGLNIHKEKTVIEPFKIKSTGISRKLKDIQNKVSGPLSINEVDEQKNFFCKLSGIPGYVERVKLDTAIYRARHRRHIASVAELLLHKVYSQNSIDDECYDKSKVDLIVWPELAVHVDDMDFLKRLSDKTGAMLLTGLNFLQLPGVEGPNNAAKWIIPANSKSGTHYVHRLQGKQNMTSGEAGKIKPWRPYQLFIELLHPAFDKEQGFRLTSSICYDSTDIKMSADLKGKSHAYIIPALNQDVSTFDSMVDALYYHMYQHVVLVNTGEFGGSVAKAPYKERHEKLISHVHGAHQVSISSFKMNMFDFRGIGDGLKSGKVIKTKPAG
jgi:hypothetical protein